MTVLLESTNSFSLNDQQMLQTTADMPKTRYSSGTVKTTGYALRVYPHMIASGYVDSSKGSLGKQDSLCMRINKCTTNFE